MVRRRETTLQREKPRGLGVRREYAFVQKQKVRNPKRAGDLEKTQQAVYKIKSIPQPAEEEKSEEKQSRLLVYRPKVEKSRIGELSQDSGLKKLPDKMALEVSEESKKSEEEVHDLPTIKVTAAKDESK